MNLGNFASSRRGRWSVDAAEVRWQKTTTTHAPCGFASQVDGQID
jgi:hypothetical protein